MIDSQACNFAIGTTLLTKAPIFVRNISPPETFDYQDFSEIVEVDEGYGIRHGFSSCTYVWINPSSKTVYNLRKLIDNAINNDRQFFVTIPINNGDFVARKMGEFSGIVQPIDVSEQEMMFGDGVIFNAISLVINNLVPV